MGYMVEYKHFLCLKCRKKCIQLIFAPPNIRFDYQMPAFIADQLPYIENEIVEVWVIGPPENHSDDPHGDCKHYTRKIWPSMDYEPSYVRASVFRERISAAESGHCGD